MNGTNGAFIGDLMRELNEKVCFFSKKERKKEECVSINKKNREKVFNYIKI